MPKKCGCLKGQVVHILCAVGFFDIIFGTINIFMERDYYEYLSVILIVIGLYTFVTYALMISFKNDHKYDKIVKIILPMIDSILVAIFLVLFLMVPALMTPKSFITYVSTIGITVFHFIVVILIVTVVNDIRGLCKKEDIEAAAPSQLSYRMPQNRRIFLPVSDMDNEAIMAHLHLINLQQYPPLAADEIVNLFHFEAEGESCTARCSICLEKIKPKENLIMLPNCVHFYHAQCITEWLLRIGNCPICRKSARESGTLTRF